MPQPIKIRHTPVITNTPNSADGTTTHLLIGESAFTIAATGTKFWVGDNAANRLLLSTVDSDAPLLTAPYAKLNGATFTGAVIWATAPTVNGHLANKEYVDTAVAASQLYAGTWDASTNTPDLTVSANHPANNGAYYVVSVAGNAPAGIPGITTGAPVNVGDHLVWNTTLSEFSIVPAGGMSQSQADARFLQLAGGTMTGVITMAAAYNPTAGSQQVATANYVDTLTADFIDGVAVDTTLHGTGTTTDPIGSATNPLGVAMIDGGTF